MLTESSGLPDTQRPALAPGVELAGRYVLEERLEHGRIGAVYKALDKQRSDAWGEPLHVALLAVPPHAVRGSALLERFKHAFAAVRLLRHPRIAAVYDFETVGETLFVTMEHVDGETLRSVMDMLSPETLSRDEAWRVIAAVGEALLHAHSADVVHGDVRAENVIVAPRGQIKVLFTPACLAASAPFAADEREDVYGLAELAYELLAGQKPPADALLHPRRRAQQGRIDGLSRRRWKALQAGLAGREERTRSVEQLLVGLEAAPSARKRRTASASRTQAERPARWEPQTPPSTYREPPAPPLAFREPQPTPPRKPHASPSPEPRESRASPDPRESHASSEPRESHASPEPRELHASPEPREPHVSRDPRESHVSPVPPQPHAPPVFEQPHWPPAFEEPYESASLDTARSPPLTSPQSSASGQSLPPPANSAPRTTSPAQSPSSAPPPSPISPPSSAPAPSSAPSPPAWSPSHAAPSVVERVIPPPRNRIGPRVDPPPAAAEGLRYARSRSAAAPRAEAPPVGGRLARRAVVAFVIMAGVLAASFALLRYGPAEMERRAAAMTVMAVEAFGRRVVEPTSHGFSAFMHAVRERADADDRSAGGDRVTDDRTADDLAAEDDPAASAPNDGGADGPRGGRAGGDRIADDEAAAVGADAERGATTHRMQPILRGERAGEPSRSAAASPAGGADVADVADDSAVRAASARAASAGTGAAAGGTARAERGGIDSTVAGSGSGSGDGSAVFFAAREITASEGQTVVPVEIRRADGAAESAVRWWAKDGTATAGNDYADLGTVTETFAPGETSRTVFIPITNDSLAERRESFEVYLAEPPAAGSTRPNEPQSTRVTIVDDDF